MGSFLAALGLVFVAELGDKTQLVAMSFGAHYRLVPVLTGITMAYAATGLVSVVVGGALGAALPTRAVGIASGVLFLGFAIWTLRRRPAASEEAFPATSGSVITSVAGAIFVAELGDKTMLATAALAAKGSPSVTWAGATIGIVASGGLGVLLGRVLGTRLPERITRVGAAALFAAFGAALLIGNM